MNLSWRAAMGVAVTRPNVTWAVTRVLVTVAGTLTLSHLLTRLRTSRERRFRCFSVAAAPPTLASPTPVNTRAKP